MKGLPPALKKALRTASRMPCKAIYSPSGERLDQKAHKYGAKRETCLYGHPHDSRKESMWCVKLHELQKEGKIYNLQIEPVYELRINNILICKHIPDFYYQRDSKTDPIVIHCEVIDVKGFQTPEWKLKYKMFQATYPFINYVVV